MSEERQKIEEIISINNPWWSEKHVPESLKLSFERPILKKILSYLELDRIMVIKGPRRTGKSTILYQMINHLINKGVSPKNIIYVSFDDIDLRVGLAKIIEIFEEIMEKKVSSAPSGEIFYFFLDEVHFLKDWSFLVKRYFDKKWPIRFIVSGSSASLIKKGAESLAGRTVEEVILPFDFKEFLSYKFMGQNLLLALEQLSFDFSGMVLSGSSALTPHKRDIILCFKQYLRQGGFANILDIHEDVLIRKLLKEDIIDKVIYKDLVEYFGIKKPYVLEKLFLYLADHSSDILNVSSISNSLRLSRPHVEKYISYLKQAYLIVTLMKYSGSIEARIRANEKAHLLDSGMISAFAPGNEDKILESVVCRHLFGKEVFYWRAHYEVDFIVGDKNPVPIEVKNTERMDQADAKGLWSFMDKYKVDKGIIVYWGEYNELSFGDKKIICIPAWLFCLF